MDLLDELKQVVNENDGNAQFVDAGTAEELAKTRKAYDNRVVVRVTTDGGTSWVTPINTDLEGAKKYFITGNDIDVSNGDEPEKLEKVVSVELVKGVNENGVASGRFKGDEFKVGQRVKVAGGHATQHKDEEGEVLHYNDELGAYSVRFEGNKEIGLVTPKDQPVAIKEEYEPSDEYKALIAGNNKYGSLGDKQFEPFSPADVRAYLDAETQDEADLIAKKYIKEEYEPSEMDKKESRSRDVETYARHGANIIATIDKALAQQWLEDPFHRDQMIEALHKSMANSNLKHLADEVSVKLRSLQDKIKAIRANESKKEEQVKESINDGSIDADIEKFLRDAEVNPLEYATFDAFLDAIVTGVYYEREDVGETEADFIESVTPIAKKIYDEARSNDSRSQLSESAMIGRM